MNINPRVAVITPTYNERGSITELIERIYSLSLPNLEVIIVDDSSPDGTGIIADELAKKYPIHVIHRIHKEGLGRAYIFAFTQLLALPLEKRPDYVIQIDADLSHDPADIPRFLERIELCDVVLGSRYIRGGGIENWSRLRRIISKFGNIYASLMLNMPQHDLTSGFKCFRREVFETINLSNISSVGYNFQIEMSYQAYKNGYSICEIPIIFTERKFGTSKFNIKIILESFWKVLLLRIQEQRTKNKS
jgi:dolichol-phosphate mannosyltransferase